MGIFDFLYKTAPRSKKPGFAGSTPYYKQRTTMTIAKNNSGSLPDEIIDQSEHRSKQNHHRPHHYSEKKISSRGRNYTGLSKPEFDVVDYYNKSKHDINDDDFTRLSRLENKIDNYIVRYDEISDELNSIRENFNSILKEFTEEFQNDIVDHKNKHIVEIGERILCKLKSFQTTNEQTIIGKANAISNNEAKECLELDRQPNQSEKMKQGLKNIEPIVKTMVTLHEDSTPSTGAYTVARAKYAIVTNTSTPYVSNTDHRFINNQQPISSHYKSTPILAQPLNGPETLFSSVDDTFGNKQYSPVFDQQSSKNVLPCYLNMSMGMHSDHPVIEFCFRRIELLRPRIKDYTSEHKLGVYKKLNGEIYDLMKKLNAIDCSKDALFNQDKNIALAELHNLVGMLERAIKCLNPECVICKSFIYKPEVSV